MTTLSRRNFLLSSGGSIAAFSLGGCALEPFPKSQATDVTLDVAFTDLELAGRRVRLRTYGGSIPGPAISTRPGDVLRIRVRNFLPPDDASKWEDDMHGLGHHVGMNVPHKFNTTNLHVHGMAVIPHIFEPIGTSDPEAPIMAIRPGEERLFEFAVPDDHPSGLYWYHPHYHGSTTVQVLNGMAGAIVVRGPIDEVPEIAAAQEFHLVVQDIALFESRAEPGLFMFDPPQNAVWDTFAGVANVMNADGSKAIEDVESGFSTGDYPLRLYLVNGNPVLEEAHNPMEPTQPIGTQLPVQRFTVRPGEVVRFRMLNGSSDKVLPVVVDDHMMHLIALDGINFLAVKSIPYTEGASAIGQEQVLIPSGGRAEFLVKASGAPGIYKIRELGHSPMVQFIASAGMVIAEIEVAGDPLDMPLPEALPTPTRHYPLAEGMPVANERTILFGANFMTPKNKILGIDFTVNGELYEETATPLQVKVGTVEVWTIKANGGDSAEGHPFHLHDNSFEVIEIDGKPVDPVVLQDTVWVGHHQEVKIRIHFNKHFVGKALLHCHILSHGDAGMMQNVLMTG